MARSTTFAIAAVLALAGLSSAASTNVPPPVTKTNRLHVPALGDASNGRVTTRVTYTRTTATASASTGRTIRLEQGFTFKLTTCVAYHLYRTVPVSSCADRVADTRSAPGSTLASAPSVVLRKPRPSRRSRFAYFKTSVQVAARSGADWVLASHSWPASGLRGAAIAVAARAGKVGTLPPNARYALRTRDNGAIDSGQPDSICRGLYMPTNGSATPDGLLTSSAAFAGAPGYYEIGQPTGRYAGRARRGTMLVIHGGGWVFNGPGAVEKSRFVADRWQARGFQAISVTPRPCAESWTSVAWFYDRARAALGPSEKICATGISAGANLALLLAARRPDIYCVVSEAAPTDLRTIQKQPAWDPDTQALTQTNGGRYIHNLAVAAFGAENLATYSPAALAAGSLARTRVLLGVPANDFLVPWAQATELRDAMLAANPSAYVDAVRLPVGDMRFGHGVVTQASLDDFFAREDKLVAPLHG